MSKTISEEITIGELAAIVSEALKAKGLEAVLSGGSVVTIYSENEYQSNDLDFVTPERIKDIGEVMVTLGFERRGRHFTHPASPFFIEFPSAPLAVGNEPVKEWGQLKTKSGVIEILTPTQSVMDRLAGYFAWNDRQNLDQAIMVASRHNVNLSKIKAWAHNEGETEKYETFMRRLKKMKSES